MLIKVGRPLILLLSSWSFFLNFLEFNKSALIYFLTLSVLLHRLITSSWLVVAIHVSCLATLFFFHIFLLAGSYILIIEIALILRPIYRNSIFLIKIIITFLLLHLLPLAAIETNPFILFNLVWLSLDFFVRSKLFEIWCFSLKSYRKSAFLIQIFLAHKPCVNICNFFFKAFVCRLTWIFLYFFFVIRAIWDILQYIWVIWYVLDQMVRIPLD
jgi:hypothetical protein